MDKISTENNKENSLRILQEYYQYNTNGNPIEVSEKEDVSTVLLWGYKGQYLIAKINNATYAQVHSALSLSEDQEPNESHLSAIDALRSNKTSWRITTYRHKPLVGVTQITQPNGVSTHYDYDDFNRLKKVKDKDNRLLEEYQYHYANPSNQ